MASTLLLRMSALRRAVSSAARRAAPLSTTPRRALFHSSAPGEQPPKSAFDKFDELLEEVMRTGISKVTPLKAVEIAYCLQLARFEFQKEQLRRSRMGCYALLVGGFAGYFIRKWEVDYVGDQDGN